MEKHEHAGRPEADIDFEQLDNFLRAQCNGTDIASYFGVHPNTLYRQVEAKYNCNFSEYSRQKKAEGKELLRAKQFSTAMQGDKTMLIWLGKQYLDQREKSDVTTDNKPLQPTVIQLTDEQIKDAIKDL